MGVLKEAVSAAAAVLLALLALCLLAAPAQAAAAAAAPAFCGSSAGQIARPVVAWALPSLARLTRRPRTAGPSQNTAAAAVSNHRITPRLLSSAPGRLLLASVFGVLLGGKPAVASPFEPRKAPPVWWPGTYFEGWFLRLVDHENNSSFCVIIGSMRQPGKPATDASGGYSSHYLGLTYMDTDGKTHTHNYFPAPETVTITTKHGARSKHIDRVTDPEFTWSAAGIGALTITKAGGSMKFTVPEVSIAAEFSGRRPWSITKPNDDGPEGWLRKTVSILCFREQLLLEYCN
jgi:hypothetical protein